MIPGIGAFRHVGTVRSLSSYDHDYYRSLEAAWPVPQRTKKTRSSHTTAVFRPILHTPFSVTGDA